MKKFRFEIPVVVRGEEYCEHCGTTEFVFFDPTPELIDYVAEQFNEDAQMLVEISHDKYARLNYLATLKMLRFRDKAYIQATTNRDVTDKERLKIVDYVDGQLSDGWGEVFEQKELGGHSFGIGCDEIYVSTWKRGFRK